MFRQLHSEYVALPRSLSAAEVLDTIPIEFVRQDFFLTQGHSFLPLPKVYKIIASKEEKENKNFIHFLEKFNLKLILLNKRRPFYFYIMFYS